MGSADCVTPASAVATFAKFQSLRCVSAEARRAGTCSQPARQPARRPGGASAVRLNVCVVTAEHTAVNQDRLSEAPLGRLARRFTAFKSASCQNPPSRELVCGFGVRRLSGGFNLRRKEKKKKKTESERASESEKTFNADWQTRSVA